MEADRYNVRMRAVLTTWNDGKAPPFPCGRQEIAKVVRNLKKDYLGALLLPPRREMPDFDEWVSFLDRFRRPVVWLQDMDTTEPVPPNRHLIRMSYGDWGKEDEDSVTGIVVRELWKRGHRVAGIASSVSWHSQWLPRRIENLRKATVRTGCPLEFRTSLEWSGNSTDADVLAPLLSAPGLTALICPNDEEAGLQYTAVKETGREVPRDISMVSFDNAPWLRPFPVSSVDFGTDGLGYKAFHLLLGLVPVHIGRKRLLQGDNILVDNGSIGPPRRR